MGTSGHETSPPDSPLKEKGAADALPLMSTCMEGLLLVLRTVDVHGSFVNEPRTVVPFMGELCSGCCPEDGGAGNTEAWVLRVSLTPPPWARACNSGDSPLYNGTATYCRHGELGNMNLCCKCIGRRASTFSSMSWRKEASEPAVQCEDSSK